MLRPPLEARHLPRTALVLLVLPLTWFPALAQRPLTFAERVAAQEAIERVYYTHQVGATRSFSDAVPREILEAKVRLYLEGSAALERIWNTRVTDEALQRELERIARDTRLPERLAAVYAALGNDPFLVKECFVRPVLVDRLVRNFFAFDPEIHAAARRDAESLRDALLAGRLDAQSAHPYRSLWRLEAAYGASDAPTLFSAGEREMTAATAERRRVDPSTFAKLRRLAPQGLGEIGLVADERESFTIRIVVSETAGNVEMAIYSVPKQEWDSWWRSARRALGDLALTTVATADDVLPNRFTTAGAAWQGRLDPTGFGAPHGVLDELCTGAESWDTIAWEPIPDGRWSHTAIWTGSLMVVFGGSITNQSQVNTGARYDPLTDHWTPTSSVGAPAARYGHTAVWTGSLMIVWGGYPLTASGGRYDPATDTWQPTSTLAAPLPRMYFSAVWAGDRMIIWGGGNFYPNGALNPFDTGGRYDPTTDSWTPTSTLGAPSARGVHQAVWTGSRMIIWGGGSGGAGTWVNTGGRYDPVADTWTPATTVGAPPAGQGFTAVWGAGRMIAWSGWYRNGSRYDPLTDSWTPVETSGSPGQRSNQSAVWTGTEMIVWGGYPYDGSAGTGGRYDPATDSWAPTATVGSPAGREQHTAVWTGSLMLVWGGRMNSQSLNTGARYAPDSDTWTPTKSTTVPTARAGATTVWTGSLMIVWGGSGIGADYLPSTGGSYDPLVNTWTPTSTTGAPSGRYWHTSVWSGSEVIVWGGLGGSVLLGDGGRYDPVADSWTSISLASAPPPGYNHSAIWTGSRMIVWGGGYPATSTGALYDPVSDSWQATKIAGAPAARGEHIAVWTGTEMVIWGGRGLTPAYLDSGGRYDLASDSWRPTATVGAPLGRTRHSAVLARGEVIVWGGYNGTFHHLDSGGRYDPILDVWRPTAAAAAPLARESHTAVWTGNTMLVWGGFAPGAATNSGGRYSPESDTWAPMTSAGAPAPRGFHGAIWADDRMIVWGGLDSQELDSGGIYVLDEGPDADGDTYRACVGDCDDSDPASHPGAAETCDGADNDCDGTSDGFATTCGLGGCGATGTCASGVDSCVPGIPSAEVCDGLDNDCDGQVPPFEIDADGDGATPCAGDCNDGDTNIHPGAAEIHDGRDNQCPGDPGFGVVDEISGDPWFLDPVEGLAFCWPPQTGATVYEVARSSDPGFSEGCKRVTTTGFCWVDDASPPAAGALYYLVRATQPLLGSWGQDSAGVERAGVCGPEICDDGVDNDGDGAADCADAADCFRQDGCASATLQYSDGPGDDVTSGVLESFFMSLAVLPSDFIHLSSTGGLEPDFEWCAERADAFVMNYLSFAVGGGSVPSEGWQVWYRPGSGGMWNGPVVDDFVNYYGTHCLGAHSWCSETGLGEFGLFVNPADEFECEAGDVYSGCGTGTAVVVITVGATRLSACGF